MEQNIPLAIGLAFVASVAFAVASVTQHVAVGDAAGPQAGEKLSGRQLLSLIRSPRWMAGLILTGASLVLQTTALLLAPVTVVQPLGVLAMPWTILLAARVHKHSITPMMWTATALTVAGTAAFTWVTIRHATPAPQLIDNWLVTGTLVGFGVAAVLAGLGAGGPMAWRCLAWSAAAAVLYGTESGVIKAIGTYVATRPWQQSPSFWFLAGSIAVAMLLAAVWIQQGYNSGPAEIVVGTLNAAGPVAAVAYGIAVLGEGANLTGSAVVLMLVFAVVALSGVVMLSKHHAVGAH